MAQSHGPVTVAQFEERMGFRRDPAEDTPRVFDHDTEAMKLLRAAQTRIQNGEKAFEITRVCQGPKIGIPESLVSRRPTEINPLSDLEAGWLRTLWQTFTLHRVNLRIRLVSELATATYAVMVDL